MMAAANKPASNPERNRLYGRIHQGAKSLFGDVSRGGLGRDEYEDWLEAQTGKRSCAAMTTAQLVGLTEALRKANAFPQRRTSERRDGSDRPTPAQWAKLGGMARDRGWSGLEDKRFQNFVKRTTGADNARFITRKQASDVVLGLDAWASDNYRSGTDDMS